MSTDSRKNDKRPPIRDRMGPRKKTQKNCLIAGYPSMFTIGPESKPIIKKVLMIKRHYRPILKNYDHIKTCLIILEFEDEIKTTTSLISAGNQ